jgi:hypothetical protein
MTVDNDKFIQQIESFEKYIADHKLEDGDYCMIVHTGRGQRGGPRVSAIYKNLFDFSQKAPMHLERVDSMFDVDFELYEYD